MPKTRRAFTLLEIMIVVTIILILIGLLVLGASKMIGGSKTQSTKVTLASLQGMLSELDAKTRLSKPPAAWMWIGTSATVVPVPSTAGFDFWRIPMQDVSFPVYRIPDALDAPADMGTDSDNTNHFRNGGRAVLNTQIVMATLLSLPPNRTAMEKTAADRQFTPAWIGGRMLAPGVDGVRYTSDDIAATGGEVVHYLPGIRMVHGGSRYICITDHDEITTSLPTTPPTTNWRPDSSPPAPILLDAWNNPIVFVPGTGLRVRLLNGEKTYGALGTTGKYENIPTDVKTAIIVSPEGKVVIDTGTGQPKVVQVGRPFWASAGPDGDFTKGDDNIYSFEK